MGNSSNLLRVATIRRRLSTPPPKGMLAPADIPDAAPDLFTAFRQQLGLTLGATKAPIDVMVIDKVEKASEN